MIFQNSNKLNAIGLPFNWNADYVDGKHYSEYDLATHKKNDFYLIQKNKVLRFGLFGSGSSLFFEYGDGSFNFNGKRVEIEYHQDNGEIHYLTTNFADKDLITYKEAYTDYSNVQGTQNSHLKSINFGYKTIYKKNDLSIHFQPIVSLPLGESTFVEIKMTSNTSMNGHLVFKVRGMEVERFEAPIEANRAGQINWTIK